MSLKARDAYPDAIAHLELGRDIIWSIRTAEDTRPGHIESQYLKERGRNRVLLELALAYRRLGRMDEWRETFHRIRNEAVRDGLAHLVAEDDESP